MAWQPEKRRGGILNPKTQGCSEKSENPLQLDPSHHQAWRKFRSRCFLTFYRIYFDYSLNLDNKSEHNVQLCCILPIGSYAHKAKGGAYDYFLLEKLSTPDTRDKFGIVRI